MQNVVCWDPQQVFRVINIEAESMPDEVFRAVHSEQPLRVATKVGETFQRLQADAFQEMSAAELLEAFLNKDRMHVQLAVFGQSGSGKSHLIRWMRMTIPESPDRMVITIPKSGASLRNVVELIINELPKERQAPFRDSLARVGDSILTVLGQKHALLNEIAQGLREQEVHATGTDAEVEQAFIDYLPHLFQDAYLREAYFLRDDGVVSALVNHVFATRSEYRPMDERHKFRAEDLPIGGQDMRNAAKPAQDAISVLQLKPEYLTMAVTLINRVVDGFAIARAFGFSAERVTSLMAELRRDLRQRGCELILLIEDFAQLQGIDWALLQALLTQGDSTNGLCKLRWAIAATTGFFATVADTVHTRMNFLVNMDRSAGDVRAGGMTQKTLATFAGRYLNAVRLGQQRLVDWAATRDPIPNACDSCPHQVPCHSAFEISDNGFGLYPFTSRALWNMGRRASEELERRFNPRTLQREVLVPVLDTYAPVLKLGQFPPRKLLDDLGGITQLSNAQRDALLRAVPTDEYDRAITFQELWDGSSVIRTPSEGVSTAFRLPRFAGAFEVEPIPEDDPPTSDTPRIGAIDPRLAALNDWAVVSEGKKLPQVLSITLRTAVYQSILGAIDWDAEQLERTRFASATGPKPFRQTSIVFQRQETTPMLNQSVVVLIPPTGADEASFTRTALALQGLLLAAKHNGEWTFPNGALMLEALLDSVSEWSADVVRQLKSARGETKDWSPIRAAVELLGVGASLSGGFKSSDKITALTVAALGPWQEEPAAQSRGLQLLYKQLFAKREALVALVRSVCSGSKGGVVGAFLDPGSVLPTLANLRRRGWKLSQIPPERLPDEVSGDWSQVWKLYQDIAHSLEAAVIEERASRLAWLAEMESAFGPGTLRQDIIQSTVRSRDTAVSAGIGGAKAASLLPAIERFRGVQYDDAIKAVSAMRNESDALKLLPDYGRARQNAVTVSREFAAAVKAFLDYAEADLMNVERVFTESAGTMPTDLETIGGSLDTIRKLLSDPQ